MSASWHLTLVGMAWYLVLPLVGSAALLCFSAFRGESPALAPGRRRLIAIARMAALTTLGVLLLDPVASHESSTTVAPAVQVVLDTSGSMAVRDTGIPATARLDEASALGLLGADKRPTMWADAAAEAQDLAAVIDRLQSAGRVAADGADVARALGARLPRWKAAASALAGDAYASQRIALVVAGLARALEQSAAPATAATCAATLAAVRQSLEPLEAQLSQAQLASDAALVAGARAESALSRGLARLDRMSRLERARALLSMVVLPRLGGHAQVRVSGLDGATDPIPEAPPRGTTDFAAALARLARGWGRDRPANSGAVLLISDGRQTTGGNPTLAARALAAEGLPVWCLAVGDANPPRDAVVAELRGPQEVFKGETVRLEARVRITGYGASTWDLVLERDGIEVARHAVVASGAWQAERFERADGDPGIHTWRVRIERPRPDPHGLRAGGGLLREVWTALDGDTIDTGRGALERAPNSAEVIANAESADPRQSLMERWRGFVVPPFDGDYTFWISSEDAGELALAPDGDPLQATTIATVPRRCGPGVWDEYQSQRSAPVHLHAGRIAYLEVLHKQGLGHAHCAVGWQLPDGRLERPIARARLAPWPSPAETAAWPSPAPEASTDNNHADCAVAVVDDPLHVLVVDDAPRWDARLLVTLFERDPRALVDCRYRAALLRQGRHDILPATQDALDAYDVVALGDLAPDELGAADQERLERFVSEHGGFVICVSGPRGMPAGYGLGGLTGILPVRVSAPPSLPPPATIALPVTPPAPAESAITSVLDDPELNRRLWPALPPLQWYLPGATPRPGADVLLEAEDAQHSPIAVVGRYGAGRVLWIASDETWRWRDRIGERVHQAFWLQAVRWGLGGRLGGADRRLQVATDRLLVEPGGALEVLARASSASGAPEPAAVTARMRRIDGGSPDERVVELHEAPGSAGLVHAVVRDLAEGRWRIEISSASPELAGLSETREVLVRPAADREGVELASDPAELARIASAGGGECGDPAQAAALIGGMCAHLAPAQLPARKTWQVWGGYGCMAALLLALGAEWILRRRSGLP